MTRKAVLRIGAVALVTAVEWISASPVRGDSADAALRTVVQRALAGNPEIAEMELRIEAAKQRVPQALALPDPRLVAGVINVPVPDASFAREDMTMKMLSVEQTIPAPGKRRAAGEVASAEVAIAEAMHVVHVNELIAGVIEAFADTAELDARLAIARRSLDRLGRVSESVRARYRVGQGALPDALLAAVEETTLRDRIRTLEADRASTAARLNTLQNLPADAPVPVLALPLEGLALPERAALDAAIDESPALLQARAEVRRAEQELESARLERRPDLTLSAQYGERQRRDDMVGAMIGVNLPFFQRRRLSARVAEKEAELAAAKKKLESTRLAVAREVEDARIDLSREIDRVALYRRTIITQAQTAAEATEQAYAVGRIDFQTYVRAVLAVDEAEAEAVMREAGLPRARAKLLAAVGLPVEGVSHD
jgi:outer membrane protein TolC